MRQLPNGDVPIDQRALRPKVATLGAELFRAQSPLGSWTQRLREGFGVSTIYSRMIRWQIPTIPRRKYGIPDKVRRTPDEEHKSLNRPASVGLPPRSAKLSPRRDHNDAGL